MTATVDGQTVTMKGPKGELRFVVTTMSRSTSMTARSRSIRATSPSARAPIGACRAPWSQNILDGVTKGFEKRLEINGVGYRAAVPGKTCSSRSATAMRSIYPIPEGITIATPKPTEIVDLRHRQAEVGQVAAEIRDYRGPEPYKGKGVKYAGEYIFRKEGKKK